MIEKEKKNSLGKIVSNNLPEEIFTEGFCDLIVYNNIVKFNIYSRPIHSQENLNSMKINKTLTFTKDNFEAFLNQLNNEYLNIKNQIENKNVDEDHEKKETTAPPKGSRIL